jgi:hypothetical protein
LSKTEIASRSTTHEGGPYSGDIRRELQSLARKTSSAQQGRDAAKAFSIALAGFPRLIPETNSVICVMTTRRSTGVHRSNREKFVFAQREEQSWSRGTFLGRRSITPSEGPRGISGKLMPSALMVFNRINS